MIKLLTAAVTILIAAVIGLGYVAFFYEAHDKAHTQDLNQDMVHQLMYDHIYGLVEASGLHMSSDDEDWAALPGIGCFWEKADIAGYWLNTKLYNPGHEWMTWNYVDNRDIWLITSTAQSCESNHLANMPVFDGPQLATWTIDDNTGEVTYGRPDYDLYESGRPADAIGNQPPSSEDVCLSAAKVARQFNDKSALEYRLAVLETQLAHACYK